MNKLAVLTMAIMLVACGENYSNGSRVGVVQKLSEKGLIWKSWEGEMMLGGMKKQDNFNSKGEYSGTSSVANVFEFNVNPQCLEKVKEAQRTGRRVELVYRQWLISPLNISNDHVVVEVRDAE